MESFDPQPSPPASPKESGRGISPLLIGVALTLFFVVGLSLGFFIRPAIIDDAPVEVVVTVNAPASGGGAVAEAPTPDVVEEAEAAVNPDSSEEPASETNTESPEVAAEATPTIMEFLMEDARHVDGNPDAPITIIEFSDFK